ncbi:hypothetical protein B296_00032588 [Ensete ventricosum]|uniref:Uncharacterized protein n=1 Tax=Ensete ventricosum TaxID=4639 RepID=A0A426YA85_ENSVE|nr:hypothetical protein B296_00032588 [Ensete ventricosum]
MKSCHDFDSTVVASLVVIWEHYSIPDKYVLNAPLPGQHPYDPYPNEFNKPEFPSAKGKEPIELTKESTTATAQWLKLMRKLCHTPIPDKDEGYLALRMTDLPSLDPDAPMAPHWSMLKDWSKVWLDRASLTEYERGILLPHLASDLYALSSEVISVMDNKMAGIRKKIEELKVGSEPEVIMAAEQCITDFQAKARQLSSELEEATRQQEASEMELNESCFLLGDA